MENGRMPGSGLLIDFDFHRSTPPAQHSAWMISTPARPPSPFDGYTGVDALLLAVDAAGFSLGGEKDIGHRRRPSCEPAFSPPFPHPLAQDATLDDLSALADLIVASTLASPAEEACEVDLPNPVARATRRVSFSDSLDIRPFDHRVPPQSVRHPEGGYDLVPMNFSSDGRGAIGDDAVRLISVYMDSNKVCGRIIVRNLSFEKHVTVRWTADRWATAHNLPCTWQRSLNKGAADQFTFAINLGTSDSAKSDLKPRVIWLAVDYAIRRDGHLVHHWDNNHGANFGVHLRPYDSISTRFAKTVAFDCGLDKESNTWHRRYEFGARLTRDLQRFQGQGLQSLQL